MYHAAIEVHSRISPVETMVISKLKHTDLIKG